MSASFLEEKVRSIFNKKFQSKPIMCFSPGRINLIGEHTDYNDGFAFPAAIDLGIVSGIQKSKLEKCVVFSIDTDEVMEFSLNDIKPIENGEWKNYVLGVIAEILKTHKICENFNLAFSGNIPLGAGLSSSAALENNIVFSINELFNLGLTKEKMIFISRNAEHNFLDVRCGIMDQYASMFGKTNSAILLDCRDLNATFYNINLGDYQFVLINSNIKHQLVESEYNERRMICENVASMLKVNTLRDVTYEKLSTIKEQLAYGDYQKVLFIIQENERVIKASQAIKEKNYSLLGELLYASHDGLQNQYNVSCKELDFLVELAKKNQNILGARMMGGGFGGCTINLVRKHKAHDFINEVTKQYYLKFKINPDIYYVKLSDGVRILDYE